MAKTYCSDCISAKVGAGAICYCAKGFWDNRQWRHLLKAQRWCPQYEHNDEGEPLTADLILEIAGRQAQK